MFDNLDQMVDLTGALPFERGSFDTVLLTDVLEHIPEPTSLMCEIARILRPKPVIRRDMKDQFATFDSPPQRIGIAQVSGNPLHFQFANLAGRTAERPHTVAAFGEKASYMPAEKSGRPRDEGGHSGVGLPACPCERSSHVAA